MPCALGKSLLLSPLSSLPSLFLFTLFVRVHVQCVALVSGAQHSGRTVTCWTKVRLLPGRALGSFSLRLLSTPALTSARVLSPHPPHCVFRPAVCLLFGASSPFSLLCVSCPHPAAPSPPVFPLLLRVPLRHCFASGPPKGRGIRVMRRGRQGASGFHASELYSFIYPCPLGPEVLLLLRFPMGVNTQLLCRLLCGEGLINGPHRLTECQR